MAEIIEFYVPQSYRSKVRDAATGPATVIVFPARKKTITWRWWSLGSRKLRSAVAVKRLRSVFKARMRPAGYCPKLGTAQIRAGSRDSTLTKSPVSPLILSNFPLESELLLPLGPNTIWRFSRDAKDAGSAISSVADPAFPGGARVERRMHSPAVLTVKRMRESSDALSKSLGQTLVQASTINS